MTESADAVSAGEHLIATVREIASASFRPGLRAFILTGSLARGEGTWLHENGRRRLAGDAEFIAVFGDHDRLPSAASVAALERMIENRLHESGLEAHIGMSPVGPRYLRRLQPHIFAYELLEHGRVIWGDQNILGLAHRFSCADIPLEDGFRLLMNRIVELLEALCTSQPGIPAPRIRSELVYYRALKLWLDMATSFLLFESQYEPTYQQRAAKLAQMASRAHARNDGLADAPLPLSRFAERVAFATDYKLGSVDNGAIIGEEAPLSYARWRCPFPGQGEDQGRGFLDLCGLIEDAHSLWRWELGRLTGLNSNANDNELLGRWLRSQELTARIRGWAATAKRYGLWRSVGMLPRWLRLGLRGSPRRLVYVAASELFFGLNTVLSNNDHGLSEAGVRPAERIRDLPVAGNSGVEASWHGAGQAVARNYHLFLESTRS